MKRLISTCASAIILAACTNAAPVKMADAKPDPRQGEEVRDICFQQQIRNWRENDHHSVIVEKGVHEEYKLELIGTCQPEDAFTSIGLISRVGGGSCLTTGDKLVTDSRFNSGSCAIHRIYKWNKDAGKAPAASSPPT
ncbi:MAG TPA: DUF6491 family protein [Hyphomonadaceae bacterium]|nr:DUF6491 family protein [Hyphomonadaceae bacterium]